MCLTLLSLFTMYQGEPLMRKTSIGILVILITISAILSFGVMVPSVLAAGGIWMEFKEGNIELNYGRPTGEHFPTAAGHFYKAFSFAYSKGKKTPLTFRIGPEPVVQKIPFPGGEKPEMATILYDTGYWVRYESDKWETENVPLFLANPSKKVKSSNHFFAGSKTVSVINEYTIKPVGFEIEIVPLEVKKGMVKAQLLRDGKPVAGSKVTIIPMPPIKKDEPKITALTDKDGVAILKHNIEGKVLVYTEFFEKSPLEGRYVDDLGYVFVMTLDM